MKFADGISKSVTNLAKIFVISSLDIHLPRLLTLPDQQDASSGLPEITIQIPLPDSKFNRVALAD